MLASIFSLNVLQTALELGCIYALVALALFLSYSILNIADLSTDGCFTLGCAVACQVATPFWPCSQPWRQACAPALSRPFCRPALAWRASWQASSSTPAFTPSIWP